MNLIFAIFIYVSCSILLIGLIYVVALMCKNEQMAKRMRSEGKTTFSLNMIP